jgi:LmbE family N-acetylglucosaminyl deacetylase
MNIILSPHFDDAVLSLGGLLAKEGGDSLIATFFAGTPLKPLVRPFDVRCGFTDSTQAMLERAAENMRSLHSLEVTDNRIRNYTHLNSDYRHERKGDRTPEPALEASISEEILSLSHEFSTTRVKVFVPGLESGKVHVDHLLVKRAAINAMLAVEPQTSLEWFFYQDLPYAADTMDRAYPNTIRNLFSRKKRSEWDYSLLEKNVAQDSFSVIPTAIPLEERDMQKKLHGISLYSSQVDHLGKHLLKRIERFARAQAESRSLHSPYCEVTYAFVLNTS